MDPHRLTIIVTHSDGSTSRWAADEPTIENIPGNVTFSTSSPGGHKDCTFTLPRSIDASRYTDESLFDDVRVLGPGGSVVWQGRIMQLPRQDEEGSGLQVGAVGYAASMLDDATFREVYVDRDLSRWEGAGLPRRNDLIAGGWTLLFDPAVRTGNEAEPGGLDLAISTDVWDATHRPNVEAWYHAGGINIGSLYYAWRIAGNLDGGDPEWDFRARLSSDDVLTAIDNDTDFAGGGPGTGTATATGDRPYATVRSRRTGAGGTSGVQVTCNLIFTCLAAYGTHGLTKRGAASATSAQGFYASDIVADVIRRTCPQITDTDIAQTSYVIPQAAFIDPTTADDVVARMNAYHQWRWGVWGRTFFFQPRAGADTVTWEASRAQGARPNLEGDDGGVVVNGIVVRFNDGIKDRVAAPPSYAGADFTNVLLEDTDPLNPCNRAGIKRWATLTLSTPTDAEGAVQIGAAYLVERNLPSRKGTIALTGWVRHPTEGLLPVSRVRAGDWIRVTDLPGDVPREIINTTYDDATRTVRCDVGDQVARLDAILERLGIQVGLLG